MEPVDPHHQTIRRERPRPIPWPLHSLREPCHGRLSLSSSLLQAATSIGQLDQSYLVIHCSPVSIAIARPKSLPYISFPKSFPFSFLPPHLLSHPRPVDSTWTWTRISLDLGFDLDLLRKDCNCFAVVSCLLYLDFVHLDDSFHFYYLILSLSTTHHQPSPAALSTFPTRLFWPFLDAPTTRGA